jgi:phosphoglycolate phosphatase
MPVHRAPALALFDIDGTLVRRAGPHHRQALEEAIRRVTGLATTTDGIPLFGMLDPDIIAEMLRRTGAPRRLARDRMGEIIRRAEEIYMRTCPVLRTKTCPGVRPLLRSLERCHIVMELVTGNLTRIGWRKLERAGLDRFFRFGAFGERARDRAGLAKLAVAHARRQGWIGPETAVTLIGDAPADVLAAQACGIRSVAVATGLVAPDELARYHPSRVIDDLRSLTPEMLL